MSTPKSEKKKKKKKEEKKEHKKKHKHSKHSHSSSEKVKKEIKEPEKVEEVVEVGKVEVIPLPVSSSTTTVKKLEEQQHQKGEDNDSDDNDNEGENDVTLNLKVSKPNPNVDPIVVSFASGVPTSILSLERSIKKKARLEGKKKKKKESNDENDSDDDSGEEDENEENDDDNLDDAFKGDVPTFTCAKTSSSSRKSSSSSKKAEKQMIIGHDSTCTYTSTSTTPTSSSSKRHSSSSKNQQQQPKTKLYIALFDKQTSTLTFQPTSHNSTIQTLSQSVSSYTPIVRHGNYRILENASQNLSVMEKRKLLFESFGTAKKKRVIKSQDANVVRVENVLGAGSGMMGAVGNQRGGGVGVGGMSESNRLAMEEVEREGVKKSDAIAEAYAEARKSFLPPFNEKASKPSGIYSAEKIAGYNAWDQLHRTIKKILEKSEASGGSSINHWKVLIKGKPPQPKNEDSPGGQERRAAQFKEYNQWPDSISLLLDSIHPGRPGAKNQLKAISLLAHMVRFHRHVKKKSFVKGNHEEVIKYVGKYPYEVMSRFIDLFMSHDADGRGYVVTKQLRDKRVVYLLILYLLASSTPGSSDVKSGSINGFCSDLGIELNEAGRFLVQAGFSVKKSSGSGMMSVSLSAPLEFPKPMKGGRKTG